MRLRISLSLVLSITLTSCAPQRHVVSVLYAGSLITPIEGPIASALAHRGITVQGEARGSNEIARLVVAGLRKPDVIVLVNPSVEANLENRNLIAESWTLGTTELGITWSGKSRFERLPVLSSRVCRNALASGIAASCFVRLLATPGLRIARTDPRLDPKGEYTVESVRMLLGETAERRVLGSDENPQQTYPEEDLLVRLQTGEADVGFVYKTEALARHLDFLPLPGRASLSGSILYTIAIMRGAAHPAAAKAFVDFLLHGAGKTILERAGLSSPSGAV